MTTIRIGNVEATLRLTKWTCDNASVLKVLQVYTSAISIGGHIPNAEEFVIQELAKELKFEVVRVEPIGAAPEAIY